MSHFTENMLNLLMYCNKPFFITCSFDRGGKLDRLKNFQFQVILLQSLKGIVMICDEIFILAGRNTFKINVKEGTYSQKVTTALKFSNCA